MRCPACGGSNRDGANFCRNCGSLLAAPPVDQHPEASELLEETLAESVSGDAADSVLVLDSESESETGETPLVEVVAGYPAEAEPQGEPGPSPEVDEASLEAEQVPGATPPEEPPAGLGHTGEPRLIPELPGHVVAGDSHQEETETWEVETSVAPSAALEGPATEAAEEAPEDLELEPGTIIAERYVLVDVQDSAEGETVYHTRDLKTCWHCGYEENVPNESFCVQCGAALDRWPDAYLLEVHDPETELTVDGVALARIRHGERSFLPVEGPGGQAVAEAPPPYTAFRLVVGQSSDAGHVRELDEDSLLALNLSATFQSRTQPVLGLFAVADGMGGHEGGEVASKLALQVLAREVLNSIILPELAGESASDDVVSEFLRSAVSVANDAVYLARRKRENDMGTTLTTIYVRDHQFFIGHVGDCRAYRWDREGLQQLTEDHSLVASMIASGRAEPEEIYTHPQRSIIFRSVGDQPLVEVDTDVQALRAGDRLIVCCDGLWEMIRSEGIADVMMQESDPQAACDLLVRRANAAGGDDNISVIVIQVEAM